MVVLVVVVVDLLDLLHNATDLHLVATQTVINRNQIKKKGIILYSLYYYVCERAIVYCGLVILGNNVTR